VHWLSALAALLMTATYVRAIAFTPPEVTQSLAQKIFYLHLPAALIAFLAFGIVAIVSALYLWLRDQRLDRIAESSAETGVVFTTVVLVTGPLWGRPIWGAFWVWEDMRLTLTLLMWFIYLGYILLRGAIDDVERRARLSAVVGVLGALLIPFIHLSVYLWPRMHPPPLVLRPARPAMPDEMVVTLVLAFAAFLVLYAAFFRARYNLATLRAQRAVETS
jgi:heme exporter protein C